MAFPTRDQTLPATYFQALELLSLGPLWTALHVLLPHERVTAAVPHRWAWRDIRPLLHEAARLVPLELNDEPAVRALGLWQEEAGP